MQRLNYNGASPIFLFNGYCSKKYRVFTHVATRVSVLTHVASIYANLLKQKKAFA